MKKLVIVLAASVCSTSFAANEKSGVTGNTLCLNAQAQGGADLYQRIEQVLGKGAVEAPSDKVYTPVRPHVIELPDDGIAGPHFATLAIEPTDVNLDGVSMAAGSDRSRTELKIAPAKGGMHEAFKGREGDTFVYAWRFRIAPDMKFSTGFTHIHQVKANGGAYSDPPLITFTPLADGKMYVRHIADQKKEGGVYTNLGVMPLAGQMGKWLDVREELVYSNSAGRYKLTVKDAAGAVLLNVDQGNLAMWRTGADHMRPKWGIYRKHSPALNQDKDDLVYFANFAITRGSSPDTDCR